MKVTQDIKIFRGELIKQFNQMLEKEIQNNKDIGQSEAEILNDYKINVIYFLTSYYAQELQSANAEGHNVHSSLSIGDSKINSLYKLDRFSQQLHESVKKLDLLQEKVYIALLRL